MLVCLSFWLFPVSHTEGKAWPCDLLWQHQAGKARQEVLYSSQGHVTGHHKTQVLPSLLLVAEGHTGVMCGTEAAQQRGPDGGWRPRASWFLSGGQ